MKKYIITFATLLIYSFSCLSQIADTNDEKNIIKDPVEEELCCGFEYNNPIQIIEIIDISLTDTIKGNVGYVFNFNNSDNLSVESVEINVILIRNSKGEIVDRYFDKSNSLHREKLKYYDDKLNLVVRNLKFWRCISNDSRQFYYFKRRGFVFPFIIIPKNNG